MEFGKLPDISNVDFYLPPDSPFNSPRQNQELACYVGATGWSMKQWIGSFYPKGAKPGDFLHHYTRQFNTIELNTTHYRIPDPVTVEKWRETAAADFRFCPKIPQTISHSKDLDASGDLLSLFCKNIAGLGEKLGCCFIQLPPYFDVSKSSLLEDFLQRFPAEIPLAIELRHESWFADLHPSWPELLAKYNRAAVITDVAGRRDVLHMTLTSPVTVIRFVGNNLHPTDYQRAADWAQRLHQWQAQGLEKAYIFTHEPNNVLAPELAAHFTTILSQTLGIDHSGPCRNTCRQTRRTNDSILTLPRSITVPIQQRVKTTLVDE